MSARSAQIERLLELVSPRTGVIRSLTRVSRGIEEPSPPVLYHALLSHYDFKKAKPLERAAAGKGLTEDGAIGSAIGEAIERYCAHHPDLRIIRRAKLGDLGAAAITPADCVLYSEAQYARRNFPYFRWTPETDTAWLPARELPGEQDILVPASLVYMNYSGEDGQDFFCPATSNGLAAGPDLDTAILRGLSELAERHGFLVHWMNRLPAPEVDFDGGVAAKIRAHYRRFDVETRVFDVSTGLPMHVMMAVSIDRHGRGPAAIVGLGCDLDPRAAVDRALFEICQVRPGETKRFRDEAPGTRLRSYQDVKTLEDHSAFFTLPERLPELAFLLESGRHRRLDDLPDRRRDSTAADLETATEGLRRAGCRVAYADLTTADVKPFGIRVVRAFGTGLQPIHFGHGEERLGGRPLFELPNTLGYDDKIRTENDLNPCPHPLA